MKKLQTGSRYEVGMEEELKEWDKSIHKGMKKKYHRCTNWGGDLCRN